MKVVHHNPKTQLSKTHLLLEAKEAEATQDWKESEQLYQQVLQIDPHNEAAYNRLMIVYRKQKEWNKEWQTVKKAISSFEEMYAETAKTTDNKKVASLSRSLLKLTGLADKKGKPVYLPGPLAKWKRRKTTLDKKLKKV